MNASAKFQDFEFRALSRSALQQMEKIQNPELLPTQVRFSTNQ
jgi:hypothetical protein